MKRRQVLRVSGFTLTVPFGGCASMEVPQNSPTQTTDESGEGIAGESAFLITRRGEIPVAKRTSEFADRYPSQEPFAEVVVGEKPTNADNLHGVEMYNDYEDSVEISLTVTTESNAQTLVFEGEGTIPIDAYMVIAISEPATYVNKLEVRGEDVNLQKTFDVPQSAWDAEPRENKGLSPQHNVHIQKNEIEVRFVGEER